MKVVKKPVNMRLSEETIKEISEIASAYCIDKNDVISVLVHLFRMGESNETAKEWFNIARRT